MDMVRALGTLMVATLVVVAGIAFWVATQPKAVEPSVSDLLAPGAARGCQACAWIESRREDQYTVRMRDGSSRIFDESPGVTWRLGERLLFIE